MAFVQVVVMEYVILRQNQETAVLWIAGMSQANVAMENVDIWSHAITVLRIVEAAKGTVEMELATAMKPVSVVRRTVEVAKMNVEIGYVNKERIAITVQKIVVGASLFAEMVSAIG